MKEQVEPMTGMFAISKAGHDKGQMYLIIKEEGDFAYLADGKSRTPDHPKKKRKKHLQLIKSEEKALTQKLKSGAVIYNEEIKFAIKVRTKNQEVANVKG